MHVGDRVVGEWWGDGEEVWIVKGISRRRGLRGGSKFEMEVVHSVGGLQ